MWYYRTHTHEHGVIILKCDTTGVFSFFYLGLFFFFILCYRWAHTVLYGFSNGPEYARVLRVNMRVYNFSTIKYRWRLVVDLDQGFHSFQADIILLKKINFHLKTKWGYDAVRLFTAGLIWHWALLRNIPRHGLLLKFNLTFDIFAVSFFVQQLMCRRFRWLCWHW